MKFSVFGRKIVEVLRKDGEWEAYYLGNEGKKRPASDLNIPSSLTQSEIQEYLADVFHEYATFSNGEIEEI